MDNRKLNIRAGGICVVLALVLILVLSVGVTLGRYTSSFGGDVKFTAGKSSDFYLKAGNWETENGIPTLKFNISNSDENYENAASDDIGVRIRAFIPEETESQSGNVGSLNLVMETDKESEAYIAKAEYLSTKTPMYKEYGAGWVYCFYNSEGEEIHQILPGGSLYVTEVTLSIESDNVDTSKIKLIVDKVSVYANPDERGGM